MSDTDDQPVAWVELAIHGRARCRRCQTAISSHEPRLAEHAARSRHPGGPTTLWYHLTCGALKRPELTLLALNHGGGVAPRSLEHRAEQDLAKQLRLAPEDVTWLRSLASAGLRFPALTAMLGVDRAATSDEACPHCRGQIELGALRVALAIDTEPGAPQAHHYLHLACAHALALKRAGEHTGDALAALAERLTLLAELAGLRQALIEALPGRAARTTNASP